MEENKYIEEAQYEEVGQRYYDVLPIRNNVVYPGVMMPIAISKKSSLKLLKAANKDERPLILLTQKNNDAKEPTEHDLYTMGVIARVLQIIPVPEMGKDTQMAIFEGLNRVQATDFMEEDGVLKAHAFEMEEHMPLKNDKQFKATVDTIKETVQKIMNDHEDAPAGLKASLQHINSTPTLVNYVCAIYHMPTETKQGLLEIHSLQERATALLAILEKDLEELNIKADIRRRTAEQIDKRNREFFLQQEIETIKKDLGDNDEQTVKELRERAKEKKWSESIAKTFEKELKRLEHMHMYSPDYSTQLDYLNTMLELPWGIYSEDNYDMKHAKEVLDRDHFGLDKVKERIVEYLAVQRQLNLRTKKDKENNPVKSPILCLYGPPGVGKTSLGRSIAEALGRQYVRVSLGGLHDEAEIRGHRRTYVGALPGRIVDNIKKCGTSNPVFVLDEVDKIGADYKGDPTSALLEVLDPEQNSTFHDNYLDVDYDLSHVLFIATANSLDTIPRPLLDRMELIEMTGYLQEEKEEIAKRHLIPKELANHGLKASQLKFKKEILARIIEDYTRESGVRSLERQIATICRKVDTKLALEEAYNVSVTLEDLRAYLGQARYSRDSWETNKYVGVVTGLAWTQVGGEILFIETSLSAAKAPTLTLTGNLGDVMKESAMLALGYVKAHAKELGIKPEVFEKTAVHIHVPEGAIPKDGPSAGITMTTALVSAFTKRLVKPRIAMTGEMTLRGKVLPIGGVKEKLLAAKRAGITDIILCEDNRKDVAEINEIYLKGLNLHFVHDISEVLSIALV
ncbi:MAG: endopeptidase La [Paludibacteraceae bacterium]|nr:endopeptidase La [Paludibacteraceae bacterium]MBR4705939.1 endopeptidase La [Paludibacteraceae bacterium]